MCVGGKKYEATNKSLNLTEESLLHLQKDNIQKDNK